MDQSRNASGQENRGMADLYTRHIEGFIRLAEGNLDRALGQYGFTVWHSLPAREAAIVKERLGAPSLGGADRYNRGTALARDGNLAEAQAHLRAALKADADFAPAAFNLALCLEKQGATDQAREAYRDYLKILDRLRNRRDRRFGSDSEMAQEAARIQQHLETLGRS